MRRPTLLVLIGILVALAANQAAGTTQAIPTTAAATIRVEAFGRVGTPTQAAVDSLQSQVPLKASVEVRGPDLRAATDDGGRLSISLTSISSDADRPTRVDVVVSAPGYGDFTYLSVPVYPNNGPILTPVLRDVAVTDDRSDVPPKRPVVPPAPPVESAGVGEAAAGCSGYTSTDTPPNLIKVLYNTPDGYNPPHVPGDGLVHTVDFQSYVAHVLPSEWPAGWHPESLRAGAIAVKMYGWRRILDNTNSGSGCHDVVSWTGDQVWDPYISYPATNQAAADTWDYYLMYTSTGAPYSTNYASGYTSDGCGDDAGDTYPASGSHMSQYGSKACADAGKVWYDILLNWYYFTNSTLKNGPHAIASTAEGLPILAPSIEPYSNTQIKLTWGGQTGVTYYYCTSSTYPGLFNSSGCTSIGTGSNNKTLTISTSDLATRYYRLRACKNGYCSAVNAGGVVYRSVSGNKFYTTVGYIWPYAQARVTARNTSTSSHTMKLYDGVPGYGEILKLTCSSVPASGKCGPLNWFPSSSSWWFDTGGQISGSVEDLAFVRLIPTSTFGE